MPKQKEFPVWIFFDPFNHVIEIITSGTAGMIKQIESMVIVYFSYVSSICKSNSTIPFSFQDACQGICGIAQSSVFLLFFVTHDPVI